ncbi:MAG: hypothetical protein ACYDB3_01195 [Acidimicrobiales bacterium]
MAVATSVQANVSIGALADWLFSGALERHPALYLALAESQVGWIP